MEEAVQFKKIHKSIEIKSGCYRPQCYKQHLHQELSVGLVRSGESIVSFEGNELRFTKGEGIIIPAYISHMCSPIDIDKWSFLMMYVDEKFYTDALQFKKLRKMTLSEVNKFESFIEKYSYSYQPVELEEPLIDLLIQLGDQPSVPSEESNIASEEMRVVYEYISQHFMDKVALDSLSNRFNINKYTLIRKFRAIYNTTPSAFQLQLKVAKAKEMLSLGKDIQEVCLALDFYDQAHLIREFKHIHGITPNRYMKDITKRFSSLPSKSK